MGIGNGEVNDDIDDELSWRVAKLRLEEVNTRRFLKARPIKLSYEISRTWIQRNWGVKTKSEFEDLVADGNLKTPYISKNPEVYYGMRGEWVSWDHYLLGDEIGQGGGGGGSLVEGGGASKWQ